MDLKSETGSEGINIKRSIKCKEVVSIISILVSITGVLFLTVTMFFAEKKVSQEEFDFKMLKDHWELDFIMQIRRADDKNQCSGN
jgi:hypothetical protein